MKEGTVNYLKGFFGGMTAIKTVKFLIYLTGCLFGYKGTFSITDCFVLAICFLCFLFLVFQGMPEGQGDEAE